MIAVAAVAMLPSNRGSRRWTRGRELRKAFRARCRPEAMAEESWSVDKEAGAAAAVNGSKDGAVDGIDAVGALP